MRYIPDWETLAETLARVMMTNGLSTSEAQRDICRALGDAKIRVQPTIDPSATEIGSQLVDVPLSPWRGERQRSERQKIVPVPLVPKNLDPQDLDWESSRPKGPWLDNRGFPVGIAKIQLSTADVIRVLCRAEQVDWHLMRCPEGHRLASSFRRPNRLPRVRPTLPRRIKSLALRIRHPNRFPRRSPSPDPRNPPPSPRGRQHPPK
jgi:hypothetical protein